jgi:hypothetical protein
MHAFKFVVNFDWRVEAFKYISIIKKDTYLMGAMCMIYSCLKNYYAHMYINHLYLNAIHIFFRDYSNSIEYILFFQIKIQK